MAGQNFQLRADTELRAKETDRANKSQNHGSRPRNTAAMTFGAAVTRRNPTWHKAANHVLPFFLASVCVFFLASCGYQFSGEGSGPEPGLSCIAIPVFKNNTSEPNAGAVFAAALRQQFMRKGTMKVVPEAEAQAVLKGTIKSIYSYPVSHSPVSVVSQRITVENRLYISLDIQCVDKKTHKVIWHDPNFSYWKVYDVNDNPLQPQPLAGFENRQYAIQYIASDMARRVHDTFLSSF